MRWVSIWAALVVFAPHGHGGPLNRLFCPTICNPNPEEPLGRCFYSCGFLKYGKYYDGSRCWYLVGTGKMINSKGYCNRGVCLKVFTTGYEGSDAQKYCEVNQTKVPSRNETSVKGGHFNATQAPHHAPNETYSRKISTVSPALKFHENISSGIPYKPSMKTDSVEAPGHISETESTSTASPTATLSKAPQTNHDEQSAASSHHAGILRPPSIKGSAEIPAKKGGPHLKPSLEHPVETKPNIAPKTPPGPVAIPSVTNDTHPNGTHALPGSTVTKTENMLPTKAQQPTPAVVPLQFPVPNAPVIVSIQSHTPHTPNLLQVPSPNGNVPSVMPVQSHDINAPVVTVQSPAPNTPAVQPVPSPTPSAPVVVPVKSPTLPTSSAPVVAPVQPLSPTASAVEPAESPTASLPVVAPVQPSSSSVPAVVKAESPTPSAPVVAPVQPLSPTASAVEPAESPTASLPIVAPVQASSLSAPTLAPAESPTPSAPVVTPVQPPSSSAPAVVPAESPTTSAPVVVPVKSLNLSAPVVVPVKSPTVSTPVFVPARPPPPSAPAFVPTESPTLNAPVVVSVQPPILNAPVAGPFQSPTQYAHVVVPDQSRSPIVPPVMPLQPPSPNVEFFIAPPKPVLGENEPLSENVATTRDHRASHATRGSSSYTPQDAAITQPEVKVARNTQTPSADASGIFSAQKFASIVNALHNAGKKWFLGSSEKSNTHEGTPPEGVTNSKPHEQPGRNNHPILQGEETTTVTMTKNETQPATEGIIKPTVTEILPVATKPPNNFIKNATVSASDNIVPSCSIFIAPFVTVVNFYFFINRQVFQ
uniref:Mucin n=1 Tax=Rhipicephalus zambeziensis TaxID=60191 RepID=A0A224YIT0_9ACAR